MFELLGLKSRPAFMPYDAGNDSSRSFEAAPAAPAAAEAKAGDACCGGGCGSGEQRQQVATA